MAWKFCVFVIMNDMCFYEAMGFNFLCLIYLFVVTGASRGYAFVEFETEREMRRAYMVMQFVSTLFNFYLK